MIMKMFLSSKNGARNSSLFSCVTLLFHFLSSSLLLAHGKDISIQDRSQELGFFVEIGKRIVVDTDDQVKGLKRDKYVDSGRKVNPNLKPDPSQKVFNGRALLYISKSNASEPRLQGSDDQETCQILGQDGYNLERGDIVEFKEEESFGYPISDLSSLLKKIQNENMEIVKTENAEKEDAAITYYLQAEFRQYRLYNRISPY